MDTFLEGEGITADDEKSRRRRSVVHWFINLIKEISLSQGEVEVLQRVWLTAS